MSDEKKSCSVSSAGEPVSERSTTPMWIIVTTLILFFIGGIYFDRHSGWFDAKVYAPYSSAETLEAYQPKSGEAALLARGKKNYEAVCGTCHGPDGLGKPGQAPPLAGSEWVTAKGFNRLAHIPLMGLAGSISVAGKDWNMNMAAMGAALPDEDLAAVLSYIRSSWGNKASSVAGDDIKQIRSKMPAGAQPVTHDMLMQMPE